MQPPSQIGPYVVERELGRGGAGIVYLATDPKLGRKVAVKVLPSGVAGDSERLRRFEREAKTLASLNQRNIAGIYDFETVGDKRYLILEYVEGESLDRVLERGPLPLADAFDCARQIADGLEAAHEKGIVHRDLKPANVRRRSDGVVKILDFGLAKEIDSEGGVGEDSLLNITSESAIVGTPAYLSPEQAQGRTVDRRADVWAFGCTLYELLSGRKAFAANTLADMLRRILEEPPDWSALPARTPQRARELLERCLEKEPRARMRDIGDARVELERILAAREWTGPISVGSVSTSRRRPWLTLAGAAIVGASLFAFAAHWSTPAPPGERRSLRFSIHPAGETDRDVSVSRGFAPMRLSPDGEVLAFIGRDDSEAVSAGFTHQLYLRRLDDFAVRVVEQSGGVQSFSFSPDGRQICFIAPMSVESATLRLAKAPVDGSAPPVTLAPWLEEDVLWLDDGTIASSVGPRCHLRTIQANGGEIREIELRAIGIEPAYGVTLQRTFPGGRALVSIPVYGPQGYELNLGLLDPARREIDVLVRGVDNGAYVEPGYLLFARRDRLLAVRFDLVAAQIEGEPVVVHEGLCTMSSWRNGVYDVSRDGTLVYLPGGVQGARRRLALIDRDGRVTEWSDDRQPFEESIHVSRDGRRLVVTRTNPGGLYEVWGSEVAEPRLRPLITSPKADCGFGVLSADGGFVIYDRYGSDGGPSGIFRAPFEGSGTPELLFERPDDAVTLMPLDVSPDGMTYMFAMQKPGGISLWVQSIRKGPCTQVAASATRSGGFSPDGEWIAYLSTVSGRRVATVRRLTGDLGSLGAEIAVPVSAGESPQWLYWSKTEAGAPLQLMVYCRAGNRVEGIEVSGDRPTFGSAKTIFTLGTLRTVYDDPLPDGRLLGILPGAGEVRRDRFEVVTNWLATLPAHFDDR